MGQTPKPASPDPEEGPLIQAHGYNPSAGLSPVQYVSPTAWTHPHPNRVHRGTQGTPQTGSWDGQEPALQLCTQTGLSSINSAESLQGESHSCASIPKDARQTTSSSFPLLTTSALGGSEANPQQERGPEGSGAAPASAAALVPRVGSAGRSRPCLPAAAPCACLHRGTRCRPMRGSTLGFAQDERRDRIGSRTPVLGP